MSEYAVERIVFEAERALAYPVHELSTVGCRENGLGQIASLGLGFAVVGGQQMQVVIAEYGFSGVPQLFDQTQHTQRVRAARHEIAGKPQAVTSGIKAYEVQQVLQCLKTALHITYGVKSQVSLSARRGGWRG